MYLRALHRQLLAAVVLFVLLLQLLLPAIAGAASNSSERWVEVCAASGVKWVKTDTAKHTVEHVSAEHCVFCAVTGAVPEFDVRPFLSPDLSDVCIPRQASSFVRVFRGYSTLSRAPPAFS
jgi:hypothetical protein